MLRGWGLRRIKDVHEGIMVLFPLLFLIHLFFLSSSESARGKGLEMAHLLLRRGSLFQDRVFIVAKRKKPFYLINPQHPKFSPMFRTEIPRFLHSIRPDGHKLPSSSSKTPSLLSRSFDENLLSRLKTLDPPSITFSWLSRAVDLLSSTHADAEALISDLSVSAPEKSLPSYLDDSIKVLDVCNSITAEIERLRQGRLLIHFVLHLLDLSGKDRQAPAPENLRKARDSLADWGKSTPAGRKSLSLENSAALIRDLAQAIGSPPRGKVQDVKKTLRRVIYTVGAVTVFVAGAVVAVLAGSPEAIGIRVPSEFLWAERFNDLQMVVSGELRTRFSGSKKRFADERESVEEAVRRVADVIGEAEGGTEKEGMSNAAKELERATEEFSDGLERLLDGVNGFFRVVLCTRNSLLKNFRVEPRK